MTRRLRALAVQTSLMGALAGAALIGQERGPQPVTPQDLQTAIDSLGHLEYEVRTSASRTIRRAPASQAVPALTQAVANHTDAYVRFRALVLLTGFNDARTGDVARRGLQDSNTRLRGVAYAWYEHNPDPGLVPQLLLALEREQDQLLRPALVRALAAQASDTRVRDTLLVDVGVGQDFFRAAVIEALGDYRVGASVPAMIEVANLQGPLQDDAALALGLIGDRRALEALAGLQRTALAESQPAVAAAICLLGVNCASHTEYLADTLRYAANNSGFQRLLRNTAAAVAALASRGRQDAVQLLFDVGVSSDDAAREALAVAVATVAIRTPPLLMATLERHAERERAVALLAEGFDMLEEDFEEERFFASVRRRYWEAPDGSAARTVAELLVQRLEF